MIKNISGKIPAALFLAELLLPASGLAATSPNLAHMTATQKAAQQDYYRSHAFGNSYGKYHPGPHWILKYQQQFALTSSQLAREMMLNNRMAVRTIEDNQTLQVAYKQYEQDAAAAHAQPVRIHSDIKAIGLAQSALAWEMIPYHMQAYELLTPSQRATYSKLVSSRNDEE